MDGPNPAHDTELLAKVLAAFALPVVVQSLSEPGMVPSDPEITKLLAEHFDLIPPSTQQEMVRLIVDRLGYLEDVETSYGPWSEVIAKLIPAAGTED